MDNIYIRKEYVEKLINYMNNDLIKIITGIRRSGKSTLLKIIHQYLKNINISDLNIIYINFEDINYIHIRNYMDIINYILPKVNRTEKFYFLFDEIQEVKDWERAIEGFRVGHNVEIFITGSNSKLLSSEYRTLLSGRYLEIHVYPLSFKEYIEINGFEIFLKKYVTIETFATIDKNNKEYSIESHFENYIRSGGFPGLTNLEIGRKDYIKNIIEQIIVDDISDRINKRKDRKFKNEALLRQIMKFLSENIGSNISFRNITNSLNNEEILAKSKHNYSINTIIDYTMSLVEAYIFYKSDRFDLRGKKYIINIEKFYVVDLGIRNLVLNDFQVETDFGHKIENIVYIELLRRGYNVTVGKIDNIEIDFIASKDDKSIFIQVTQNISKEDTYNREIKPLLKLKTNHEKLILVYDSYLDSKIEGVRVMKITDWLLTEESVYKEIY